MRDTAHRAVAIVGLGSVLPGARNTSQFWDNLQNGRYSISDVDPKRWDPALYYDPDPKTPDATYSKIGGWVREWDWDPIGWRLPVPPKVADSMDIGQHWAINCTRAALADFGYPDRKLDLDRTAVILGNAMAGEKHYLTALRVSFPEFARELEHADSFRVLPQEVRTDIINQTRDRMRQWIPDITEDSMPGELANCIAGRIANLFNFHGPNYVVDAACASAMAAITAACEGLEEHDFDTVLTGGIDRNMGASTYVKFSKIGALSASGTRPYADGADGFVMGEGAALFLLKRLEDAERDGDRIYAVLRGMGGSSDGKGKGITAPNPVGQKLCIQRAWENAGLSPATATYVEGHGTSTRVGDRVECESLGDVFAAAGAATDTIWLGSVKSNIGHLKGGAGAAGILKTVLALHDKVLPPSLNCDVQSPAIDFEHSPFQVNTELRDWEKPECGVRRAGVSAFGFGGTNFHAVLEEHIPGKLTGNGGRYVSVPETIQSSTPSMSAAAAKAPVGGAVVVGAKDARELGGRLQALIKYAESNRRPPGEAPLTSDLEAPERIAIDFDSPADLAKKAGIASKALERNDAGFWKALGAQGIFHGAGDKQKIAFLYPGQGSQYLNMLKGLRDSEPAVREVFDQADRVMKPHLDGRTLSELLFVDESDEVIKKQANHILRQTEITQPVVLTVDTALSKLLAGYGIEPDMVMGHSLGEYGALVASGAMDFADALEAVSARGREMASVSMADNGKMAAVFAPLDEVQRLLARIDGYVVIANLNSTEQAVIGGESPAIDQAVKLCTAAGIQIVELPVSHAFHTKIVAPASAPLRRVLSRMNLRSPALPTISNVTGQFYPQGDGVVEDMLDLLARQIASPVQFIKGLDALYDAGARVYVEVGPKSALKGFVDSALGDKPGSVSLFTNHPKVGETRSFNQALCGLYAAGHGQGRAAPPGEVVQTVRSTVTRAPVAPQPVASLQPAVPQSAPATSSQQQELTQMFRDYMERGLQMISGKTTLPAGSDDRIVISGAALGLPGTPKVFDEDNIGRILHGEQFIDVIPYRFRQAMASKHITRLVKRDAGGPTFERIDDTKDVVKLAGRAGEFDIAREFGVKPERAEAFDSTTALAIGVGLDALRDAGIPLTLAYKTTTTGSQLPDRWRLPDALRDETGIIFASAFPGVDAFAADLGEYYTERGHREQLQGLESLREWLVHHGNGASAALDELDRRIAELKSLTAKTEFRFDRKFLFRILAMGHSQFAEEIGARGPNTQVNSACASTTQAVSVAEDWIRAGRCRRVIIVSADNVTSDHLLEWIGAGFLASGAAATDEKVEDAATPFDRRRHGMIAGMGAAALVIESESAVRERGLQPIGEVLGAVAANSAFHGTRLDVNHIAQIMEQLVSDAERRHGIRREDIAAQTMFVSHETYTPARGGSASAEIYALRAVFGDKADQIVISNTKGFTGHAMGAGVEDVVAIKALETGIVPPVPNFKEVDPELGTLNLSTGGSYPVQYALRLGAGFGSQIAMTLVRWMPSPDGRRRNPDQLGYQYRVADGAARMRWLADVSGYDRVEEEVAEGRLRIKDQGPPAKPAAQPAVAEPVPATNPAPVTAAPAAVVPAPATTPTPRPVAIPSLQVAAEPVPLAPATAATDPLEAQVMAVVADATGYPAEMLEPDLDLEADLGIDTVKQAEVFATIRAEYDIPRDENLQLREFPTLKHVVQFVRDRAPDLPAFEPVATEPPPATATEAPVAAAPSAVAATQMTDGVEQRVIDLVADKTGYPADMLELDLDLEADLGVDTVKQAEVFATIREAYDIPRDENMQLREFPTLKHVVQFVRDRAPDLPMVTAAPEAAPAPATQVAPAAASPAPAAAMTAVKTDGVEDKVIALVADKTGYPADMLELDLDLEADLGVDTVKQAEVFASIRGEYDIPRDENLQLREFPTLKHVVQFVRDRAPDLPMVTAAPEAAPAPATPVAPAAASPVPTAAMTAVKTDGVEDKVIALVADKTGYPADMLELDLDLEADLGVDTVKQAEVFASIRGEYDIPRDENLQLREFPTLKHVVQFVRDRAPDLPMVTAAPEAAPAPATQVAPAAASPAPTAAMTAVKTDGVEDKVIALVADKTGYPADMLELDLDLEADLGVDTVKQAEVFASIRGEYDIPRDENLQLREFPTLKHVVQFVYDRAPNLPAAVSVVEAETAPATPIPGADAGSADDAIKARVLEIVADKTGYPADMLELDLDLEADLGIDTVKQAEIFAAMRAAYGIPRDENLQLQDFPTLRDSLRFVKERMPGQVAAPAAAAAEPAPTSTQQFNVMAGDMEAADRVPRRVPTAFWRPSVDLCKTTGVSLAEGARVIVSPDQGGVGRALIERLQKRGVETLVIENAPDYETLESQLDQWLDEGDIDGVYWLNALDSHAAIEEIEFAAWSEWLRANVKSLAVTMRKLYDSYATPGKFLLAATRLGGKHGYDDGGALNPMGGAVSGFVKTFKRERGDALCKAVDFEVSRKTAALADRLIDETLSDHGVVEVGIQDERRWNIGFTEQPADPQQPGIELGEDSVFVITGAAGSIVSAIIGDLADASHGTFHLLDLCPEPDRNDPEVAKFATDKDGLKRDIFGRLKASGERATPAMVEKELARLERAQSALAAIDAVERAGGTAHYHAVDMTDVTAVEAVMHKVRKTSGKIDVLLHAAGIEISHFLGSKPQREFDLVFDIKCNGWYGLMHGIGDMPLQAAVVFSSVAGRFGNAGQTDYSAANDLLCKGVSGFAVTRPETRGIAIDWTAWGGIGMATRGSIPVMMAAAGIDMLPPEAGIPVVRRELTRGWGNTEVVIAGRLGVLTEEWDETGGLQIDALPEQKFGPMTGRIVGMGVANGLTVETELDPAKQPFLYDHAIDGVPVLPGVMGLEAFAELSRLLLPDWQVESIDNIQFMSPFKFYRSEPRKLRLTAQFQADNGGMYAHCSLIGERQIKTQPDPVKTVHFTATVHLSREGPQPVTGDKPIFASGPEIGAEDVYNVYFHGPAYQVLESAWGDGPGTVIGRMASDLPENHSPADLPTQIAPRAIELCFQTAGMYELGEDGILGLPWQIGSVSKLREFHGNKTLYSIVRHTENGGGYNAEVVDEDGDVYIRLHNYRTTELPGAADAERIEPIRMVLQRDPV